MSVQVAPNLLAYCIRSRACRATVKWMGWSKPFSQGGLKGHLLPIEWGEGISLFGHVPRGGGLTPGYFLEPHWGSRSGLRLTRSFANLKFNLANTMSDTIISKRNWNR